MKKKPFIKKQLHELMYQALETERGGVKIYEAALTCAQNEDLTDEWEEYLEQTRTHEQVLLKVFKELVLNPETASPGRECAPGVCAGRAWKRQGLSPLPSSFHDTRDLARLCIAAEQ